VILDSGGVGKKLLWVFRDANEHKDEWEMITAIQQELDNPKKEHFRSDCRYIATMLSWETIVSKIEKLIDEAFNGIE